MKSYTDIEQSKKLAEILPLESADMVYIKHSSSDNPTWEFNEDFPPMNLGDVPIKKIYAETLPCWSLVALLKILPLPTIEETMITTTETKWKCTIYCESHAKYWSELHNDAIDAAFEMVCWLKENNKL